MNNEKNSNIPQPDPAWDYYPTWHLLNHVKFKIDGALKAMSDKEVANRDLDNDIKDLLSPASDNLTQIIEQLSNAQYEDE